MSPVFAALVLAAVSASEPILLEVDRGNNEIVVRFELASELPEPAAGSLSSGATVEINYPLRVYSRRRMIPDRRVWKGVARATVAFDAVTGRYLCQLVVNGSTTVSREVETEDAARRWLLAPPAVEVPLPQARRDAYLRVRVRAVFASGTSWLVFPTTEGTDWVEVRLEAQRDVE
jgi:hypothetical protein